MATPVTNVDRQLTAANNNSSLSNTKAQTETKLASEAPLQPRVMVAKEMRDLARPDFGQLIWVTISYMNKSESPFNPFLTTNLYNYYYWLPFKASKNAQAKLKDMVYNHCSNIYNNLHKDQLSVEHLKNTNMITFAISLYPFYPYMDSSRAFLIDYIPSFAKHLPPDRFVEITPFFCEINETILKKLDECLEISEDWAKKPTEELVR